MRRRYNIKAQKNWHRTHNGFVIPNVENKIWRKIKKKINKWYSSIV